MAAGTYTIALIQMEATFLDDKRNAGRALKAVEDAADRGARLIVLPEGFMTGYIGAELDRAAKLACTKEDPRLVPFFEMAASRRVFVLLPVFERRGEQVFNSAWLIDDHGELVGSTDKTHLITPERGIFTPGSDLPVWETELGAIGCLICYDLCFPETARALALKGAQVILVPSAWRSNSYYTRWWNLNAACRALDNLVYIAAVNQTGACGDEFFAGHSMLCAPTGEVIAQADESEETIVYGQVDPARIALERELNTVLADRRGDLY